MSEKKALTAADILGASRPAPSPVDVPEWGGVVFVRHLSAGEADDLEFALGKDAQDDHNFRGRVIAACACDEKGNALFGEAQAGELANLGAAPAGRVYDEALRLNRIGPAGKEATAKN